ncbi:MAG: pyridoxamine 5'-phosphate oxidase family protein [Roseococcus sp.]
MTHGLSDDEARIKVRELIEQIRVVMLVTTDAEGGLDARPMSVLEVDGDTVRFFTDVNSPKTMAIGQDHQVLLACANPSGQDYVSVRGKARVTQDVEKQKALWTEMARLWFPDGAASPNLALVSVEMTGAEYWDGPNSLVRFAYGYAKAMVTKTPPVLGENAKVRFGVG